MFIVWTIICGVIAAGFGVVTSQPVTCFECGMTQALAGIAAQMTVVIWAIVSVFFMWGSWRPPP